MAESRVKCINSECSNMIQPATAKRNDGMCGPCHGKLSRAKYDAYVRENRRTVDLFEGMTDPTDILRAAHTPKPIDPLISYAPPPQSIEKLYASLSLAQAEAMMNHAAMKLIDGDVRVAEDVARHLAAFTSYNLDGMLKTWVDEKHFWPAIAFRFAGPSIRSSVLLALQDPQTKANHALQAAAWIGGDEVARAFGEFDKTNPPWATSLYVKPSVYAQYAGWEVIAGKRRELSYPLCLAMVPTTAEDASSAVQVFKQNAQTCTCCGNQLVSLLSLDPTADSLARLGMHPSKIDVVTCHHCTCYGTIFAQQDERGAWQVLERPAEASRANHKVQPSPWTGVAVKLVERSRHHAADQFLSTKFSQIGGLPMWVQHPDFPTCPSCNVTMVFLAQIDNGLFAHYEGVFHAFLCHQCMITATTYQQS